MDKDSLERELQILQDRDLEIGQSRKGLIEMSVSDSIVVSRPYEYPDFEPYVDFLTDFALAPRGTRGLLIRFFLKLRTGKTRVIGFCTSAFHRKKLIIKRIVKRLRKRLSIGHVASRHE